MKSEPAAVVRCHLLGGIDVRNAAGDQTRALLVQPKRLALFAYLVLRAGDRLTRRDSLLALLWPESTEHAARHSLRQTLHGLRLELGAHVLTRRGNDEVGIDASRVWCDVTEFERAIRNGRYADALALYTGPLLEGFHVGAVASGLERWFDDERTRLHALARQCARALTDEAERAGDHVRAIQSARDAARLDPLDEGTLRRLMSLLRTTGDRTEALRTYDALTVRLAAELELSPSEETRAIANQIRRESAAGGSVARVVADGSRDGAASAVAPIHPTASRHPRRPERAGARRSSSRLMPGSVGVALAAAIAMVVAARGHASRRTSETLAVGSVRIEVHDTALSPQLVRELLATDLARMQGVGVVSAERMDELRAQLISAGKDTLSATALAARAGAARVVEGILSGDAHSLRLDVRLVDPRTGVIRAARAVEASDVFSLADAATAWVAEGLGRPAPSAPLTDVTSTSLVARRFYDEGLRALNQGDRTVALRLFRSALAEDSNFLMAAYYASQCAWVVEGSSAALALLSQGLRAATHASERERLFVAAAWASATNDPAAPAIAESLATRYPLEPDGGFLWGASLAWSGDRGRAIPILQQAVDQDAGMLDAAPADTARQHLRCHACDALAMIIQAYTEGDSLELAERAAREWTRRQPTNGQGWLTLAQVQELEGKVAEALTTQREASRRLGRDLADDLYRARLAIRAGDFGAADRLLIERAAEGDLAARAEALWWLAISLRHQNRTREALSVVDDAIAARDSADHEVNPASAARMARAEILLELGRAREAATAFESISAVPVNEPAKPRAVGVRARRRAWGLALAATAYANAGDTARLFTIADSVEAAGRQSLYGRDRKLAAYVRGLMYEARHDDAAAEAAFRGALYSPNLGYTRVNVALARVLIAQRRPLEAVPILRAAMRGSLEGSCYYVTRTEVEVMLARAFAAAGQQDSARYYRLRATSATAGRGSNS